MNSPILQLLVLAGIAVFLILRLRSVLGSREGFEKPPAPKSSSARSVENLRAPDAALRSRDEERKARKLRRKKKRLQSQARTPTSRRTRVPSCASARPSQRAARCSLFCPRHFQLWREPPQARR